MSSALTGFGTQLQLGDGASPEVFTTVAEVNALSGPSLSKETIDVTNHDSVARWREFISSLRDGGEITFSINYIPDNVTHGGSTGGLIDELEKDVPSNWNMVFQTSPTTTFTFPGVVTQFEPDAPIDDKLSADCTIKVTGQPTLV